MIASFLLPIILFLSSTQAHAGEGGDFQFSQLQLTGLLGPKYKEEWNLPSGIALKKTGDAGWAWIFEDQKGQQFKVSKKMAERAFASDVTQAATQVPENVSKANQLTLTPPIQTCGLDEPATPSQPAPQEKMESGPKVAEPPDPKSQTCVPYEEHLKCPLGKKKICDRTVVNFNKGIQSDVRNYTLEAVNAENERLRAMGKLQIDPAMVLSLMAAESGGNPLAGEKGGSGIGKGLFQFSFNSKETRVRFKIDYTADLPASQEVAMSAEYDVPNKNGLYPVWSGRASIRAVVKYFSEEINTPQTIRTDKIVEDEKTKEKKTEYRAGPPLIVNKIWTKSDTGSVRMVEATRYLAGMHNRGAMVFNSVEEHFRQTGTLPFTYAQAWEVSRNANTPKGSTKDADGKTIPGFDLLTMECTNRCHVEKIAGLCGDEPQGFYKEYLSYFKEENGVWSLKS